MEGLRTNEQIELARDFLYSTGVNIFLTGKAGSGKTTLLRSIVEQIHKRVVVAAPTGVAALNARGVTLHSLFQLPFGINIPEMKSSDWAYRKIGRKKLALIRSIELLVIDEISMVRCDLLDAVDETLRRIRRSNLPFGGVQLLMIGDIEQLSPICPEQDWQILSQHYASPYFFDSKVLQSCPYITIELKEIFRQQDSKFTDLLNAVRENKITPEVVKSFNTRYLPLFEPRDDEGYITLTTHNNSANKINSTALASLTTPSHHFEATVQGDYPEWAYPNEATLELKEGAQVIFIKNDISPEKLFYNGLIGRIESIEEDQITVVPNNGAAPITISTMVWENIEYTLNDESGEIEESIKGTYTQVPLKCAWAITIHKSQGLSFDKAIIDAGNSFAHGQVYVALSRCRSFEGLVLRTPLRESSIIRDNSVEGFNQSVAQQEVGAEVLERERRDYFCKLLCEIFDFEELNKATYSLSKLLNSSLYMEYPILCNSLRETTLQVNHEVQRVGEGFKNQLRRAVASSDNYLCDTYIEERLLKASTYFSEQLSPIAQLVEECTTVKCDIKDVTKRLKPLLDTARQELSIKCSALTLCVEGFSCEEYLKRKFKIITEEVLPKPKVKREKAAATPSDVTNAELYEALRAWRTDIATQTEKPAYTILSNRTLLELQAHLPKTIDELNEISGIGPAKLQKYGDQLLEIVQEYALYSQKSNADE